MELICLSWLRVQRWKLRVQYFEHLPKAEKFCFIWADCIQRRIWGILFAPGNKHSIRILRPALLGSWLSPFGPRADMKRSSSIWQIISGFQYYMSAVRGHPPSPRLRRTGRSTLSHHVRLLWLFSAPDSARTKATVIALATDSSCHH